MSVQTYQDLIVWQKARLLAKVVYIETNSFPAAEKYGLVSQMRRCAVSVMSNIAEGQGRRSTGEFLQFLGHARGSLFELESQVILSHDLELLSTSAESQLRLLITDVGKLLTALIRKLEKV